MLVDGLEIALKRSILHTSLIFHKFHILVIDKSTVNRYQSDTSILRLSQKLYSQKP